MDFIFMNRIIKELAEQAEKTMHISGDTAIDLNEYTEKFSELLLKEALELVNDEVSYMLNDVNARRVCETVLEYFGIC